jgi:pyruvate/2-oxoglutarate dehydrogenase complex dihydrolipoamide acyltransferase (E2) component
MPDIIPITMPKFGLAMTEGKIASWAVSEGARVDVGDEIADIETTKITNAYESPVAGVIRRHVAKEQEDLPVGALIAVIAEPSVPDSEIDASSTGFRPNSPPPPRPRAKRRPNRARSRPAGGRSVTWRKAITKAGRWCSSTASAAT